MQSIANDIQNIANGLALVWVVSEPAEPFIVMTKEP